MTPPPAPGPETLDRIKKVLRANLKIAADKPVPDDMPLIGGSMDMDSLDVLLIVTAIEKEFGFKIPNEAAGREAFSDVAALARFVDQYTLSPSPASTAARPLRYLRPLPPRRCRRHATE